MISRWILVAVPLAASTLLSQDPSQTPAPKPADELRYPTFEPFVASRMFGILGEPESIDLEEAAQEVTFMAEAGRVSLDAANRVTEREPDQRPSARLMPELPEKERPIYSLLPIVMMKLAPLWEAAEWSAEQVRMASLGAKVVGRITGAPNLAFREGEHEHNRAELEKLVRWFHAIAARPEGMAAMIFTIDMGPYAGLPYAAAEALEPLAARRLDERTELRLAKVDREHEPWVMQCVRDGKPLWTRVVSGAPDGDVSAVRFARPRPAKRGSYGWEVFLVVDWPMGEEGAHLYVDAQGRLLFYYLSW